MDAAQRLRRAPADCRRHLFETAERAAVPADRGVALDAPPLRPGYRRRRVVPNRARGFVRSDRGDHRRSQLSGRGTKQLLRDVPVPEPPADL